jgi:ureidoacrylate peracid hydrolase
VVGVVVIEDCVAEPIGSSLERTNHEATLLTLEILFASIAYSSSVIDALTPISLVTETAGG